MRHRQAVLACCVLLCAAAPAAAVEPEFKALAKAVESRFGVKRQGVPMMGFASFVARVSSANAVNGLSVATFEGLSYSENKARDFGALVSEVLNDGWTPIVRVRSRRSGEWTSIYVKGDEGRLRMMVATLEKDEATLVELKLHPRQLLGWLKDPERAGECGPSLAGDSCE